MSLCVLGCPGGILGCPGVIRLTHSNAFKPPLTPLARAAVRSKPVVLLLLIYCFMYLPLFVGVLCWSLFWYALLYVHSSFVIILTRKREQIVCDFDSYSHCLSWAYGTI